jgi:hypothetical protein
MSWGAGIVNEDGNRYATFAYDFDATGDLQPARGWGGPDPRTAASPASIFHGDTRPLATGLGPSSRDYDETNSMAQLFSTGIK